MPKRTKQELESITELSSFYNTKNVNEFDKRLSEVYQRVFNVCFVCKHFAASKWTAKCPRCKRVYNYCNLCKKEFDELKWYLGYICLPCHVEKGYDLNYI